MPEGNILPNVSRAVISSTTTDGPHERNPNLLTTNSGVVVAVGEPQTPMPGGNALQSQQKQGLPFDEEAKLVFGLILSLRSMIKKLSGKYVDVDCSRTTGSLERIHFPIIYCNTETRTSQVTTLLRIVYIYSKHSADTNSSFSPTPPSTPCVLFLNRYTLDLLSNMLLGIH